MQSGPYREQQRAQLLTWLYDKIQLCAALMGSGVQDFLSVHGLV